MKKGVIRPRWSPYGSPMFFAKEKDGTLRGVVDYRALHRITKTNSTAMPIFNEIFDQLGYAKVFLGNDFKFGSRQTRMIPKDMKKPAFPIKYS